MMAENLLEDSLSAFVNSELDYFDDLTITPLKGSLLNGSIDEIQEILCKNYGVELKFQNSDWTHKCREIVNVCLDLEIDVNLESKYSTLLHFVVENLYEDFNSVLMRCKDFTINALNICYRILRKDKTLLHLAVEKGRTNIVKRLLELGADVNIQESVTKLTPLFYAVSMGQVEVVKMLLQSGADINVQDYIRRMPINYIFCENEIICYFNYGQKMPHWELIKLLCAYKNDLNFKNNVGTSLLCDACGKGLFEEVRFLVDFGADLLSTDVHKNTPLHHAALGNNFALVDYLLRNGVDIKARNSEKETVIFELATIGRNLSIENEEWEIPEFVPDLPLGELLFKIDEMDKAVDMIEFLVDCGADANGCNFLGDNPLSQCIARNSLEIVGCLLELKVDTNPESYELSYFYYHEYIIQNMDFYSDRPDTCVLLTAFLATKDVDIFKYLYENLGEFEWVPPFFQQCKAEVSQMKKRRICNDRSVTFFDFLTKDLMEVLLFCRNEEIVTILESGKHKEEFRIYKYMLEKRMERVQKLKNCKNVFMRVLKQYFKKSLPLVILDEIISYLTAGDLRNFGRALCISKDFPDGNYYYTK